MAATREQRKCNHGGDVDRKGQGVFAVGDITIYFLDFLWPGNHRNKPWFNNLRPYRNIIPSNDSKTKLEIRLSAHF